MKTLNSYILSIVLILGFSITLLAQDNSTFNIGNEFIAAGYMGCTENIEINPASIVRPYSAPLCIKIEFLSSCKKGWAGTYWTNIADDEGANWGQYPGTDLSNKGFTKITFWARGENGNEVVEFGSGGIYNTLKDPEVYKYKDSYNKRYSTEGKAVVLSNEWKKYTIDLSDADLSSVIGGFFWAVNWRANPTGVTFYLDDIIFE
jgi:hypothetical protein